MHVDKIQAGDDAVHDIALLMAAAIIGLYLWSWWNFFGPFRWLIDREIELFGNYWDAGTGLALGAVTFFIAVSTADLFKRLLPSISPRVAATIVALVILASSGGALTGAWRLWDRAAHLPSLKDPIRVVDLDPIGSKLPLTGHVRLIGVPDSTRQVITHYVGRHGSAHWDTWVPMIDRPRLNSATPVAIVATRRASDERDAAKVFPNDPEGVLLTDALDTRTLYEIRQQGLNLSDHPSTLYWPGDDVTDDGYIGAVILVLSVVLFWSFALYSWITGRGFARIRTHPIPATGSGPASPVVAGGAILTPANTPAKDFHSSMFSAGMVAAIAAVLLYRIAWSLTGYYQWAGLVASGLMMILALLFMAFGLNRDATLSPAPNLPHSQSGTAVLYVMRDEKISGNAYMRVDVDGARAAVLKANCYSVAHLQPGEHVLAVNGRISLTSDTVSRFDSAAGETVVYQLLVPFIGRPRLERITDLAAARARLAFLKRV